LQRRGVGEKGRKGEGEKGSEGEGECGFFIRTLIDEGADLKK
jgi:hypothetical protein